MKISKAKVGFITFLKANGYSQSTVDLYRYVLNLLESYLQDKNVESIKRNDLDNYFVFLREEYVPKRKNGDTSPVTGSTLQNHWKGLRTFFNWAEEYLELKNRPDLDIKLPYNNPKEIMPFTEEEVQRLVKCAQFSQKGGSEKRKPYQARRRTAARDLAMILMLLDTGLRIGELCRLNVGDINIEHGDIWIAPYGNSNRKTKSRIVHFGKSATRSLWQYLAKRPDLEPSDPLFIADRTGKRMTVNGARCLLKDLGKVADVNNCHPHRFRHTFCIEFLRNNGDLFTLQQITGHTSLEMLKHYMKIATGDTSRVHKKASPADNWKL
jgi:site-specific recombinase XerD